MENIENIENEETEIWKDIPNFGGRYQMSNKKRVKSVKRYSRSGNLLQDKILKAYPVNGKFDCVCLRDEDGKPKHVYLARIFYELFEKPYNEHRKRN